MADRGPDMWHLSSRTPSQSLGHEKTSQSVSGQDGDSKVEGTWAEGKGGPRLFTHWPCRHQVCGTARLRWATGALKGLSGCSPGPGAQGLAGPAGTVPCSGPAVLVLLLVGRWRPRCVLTGQWPAGLGRFTAASFSAPGAVSAQSSGLSLPVASPRAAQPCSQPLSHIFPSA